MEEPLHLKLQFVHEALKFATKLLRESNLLEKCKKPAAHAIKGYKETLKASITQ